MNVINDVLNELEKRGANVPLGEAAIRPVPPRREPHLMRYVLLAALLLALVAVAKWYLDGAETRAPESPAAMTEAKREPIAPPATSTAAPSVGAVSGVPLVDEPVRGKELLVAKDEEEPVAAPPARKAPRHKPHRAKAQPASSAEDVSAENSGNQPLKKISPQQRADAEFGKANTAAQEGRTEDALAGYEAALLMDPSHKAARRAWAGLLIGLKRNDDAEQVLEKGLKRDPQEPSFAMLLARLQVERNAVPLALETLQRTLPYAAEQADYQAFVAALLQRVNRHDEAIAHYQAALKQAPGNGIWLMGIGISLQATQHNADAREAFRRALASNSLSPQLQAFVQAKLKEL